jgi:hypothetical protein
VYKPNLFIARSLTLPEVFRIYDLPLSLDPALLDGIANAPGGFNPNTPLPFEDAVSPSILTSIFRMVWGFMGGLPASELADVCVTGAIPEAQPVPNIDIEACSSDLDIPADCADSADDQSTDVFDDQSIALESIQSGHTELIVGPNHKGSDAYQWDEDSDGDSLMPRRRHAKTSLGKPCPLFDWEGLDDESTCCLDSTDETASLTSCEEESYSDIGSSVTADSISTGSESQASLATVITSTTKRSVSQKRY